MRCIDRESCFYRKAQWKERVERGSERRRNEKTSRKKWREAEKRGVVLIRMILKGSPTPMIQMAEE